MSEESVPDRLLRTARSILSDRLEWAENYLGMTFGNKRNMSRALGHPQKLSPQMLREKYERGGIAGRIVDCFADATWRGGLTLVEDPTAENKNPTQFESAWTEFSTRLKFSSKMRRADKLSGLGRFSVLLIGGPGEVNTELPRGNPEDIQFLKPYSEARIKVLQLDKSIKSQRYGQPLEYQLIGQDAIQKPIHFSRLVHLAEDPTDDDIYATPRLMRVWNDLENLMKLVGGGSEAFWLRANQGLAIKIDREMNFKDTAMDKLKEDIDNYQHELSRILRIKGGDVQALGSDVADFKNNVDTVMAQIAGTVGIPQRILLGSEIGMASADQDDENWKQQVQDRRTNYAEPDVLRVFVDRMIEYGYLPTPKQYSPVWGTIEARTEMQRGQIANAMADVNVKLKNAGLPKAFHPDEIRDLAYGLAPNDDLNAQFEEDKATAEEQFQQSQQPLGKLADAIRNDGGAFNVVVKPHAN